METSKMQRKQSNPQENEFRKHAIGVEAGRTNATERGLHVLHALHMAALARTMRTSRSADCLKGMFGEWKSCGGWPYEK